MALSALLVAQDREQSQRLSRCLGRSLTLSSHTLNDEHAALPASLSCFDVVVVAANRDQAVEVAHRIHGENDALPIIFLVQAAQKDEFSRTIKMDPLIKTPVQVLSIDDAGSLPNLVAVLARQTEQRLSAAKTLAQINEQLTFSAGLGTWPEAAMESFVDRISIGVIVVRHDGGVDFANRWILEEFPNDASAANGPTGQRVNEELLALLNDWFRSLDATAMDSASLEFAMTNHLRQLRSYEAKLMTSDIAVHPSYLVLVQDVTIRREMELARQSAEKSLAVAHMSAGVNHHMNNILAVILGNAEILSDLLPLGDPESVAKIVAAVERAIDLNRGLLRYVGQEINHPQVFECCALLRSSVEEWRRRAEPDVRIELDLGAQEIWINADPVQFRLSLSNVFDNAMEAMKSSGSLTVSLRRETTTADGPSDAKPTVAIELCDTGPGFSNEAARLAFDPFFTTKGMAVHTGLGLSMVLGFARQSDGTVTASNAPGHGACVTLVLPVVDSQPA